MNKSFVPTLLSVFATAIDLISTPELTSARDIISAQSLFSAQDLAKDVQIETRKGNYINYLAQQNKNYKDLATINQHFAQWQITDATIKELNEKALRSGTAYKAGHNFTSDLTVVEFAKWTGKLSTLDLKQTFDISGRSLAATILGPINYVKDGFTTLGPKTKNQTPDCFGANITPEAALPIQTGVKGKIVRLSEQECMDCTNQDKNASERFLKTTATNLATVVMSTGCGLSSKTGEQCRINFMNE